jgi:uncharacterized membrane-anchored protein
MRKCAAALLFVLASSVTVWGQEEALPTGWEPGPTVGKLGTRASVTVPEGYFFLNAAATRKFLEQNENIPRGDELGTIIRVVPDTEDHWFAVFSYADTGHIDDGEKDSLDATALMKSMQEGSRESNKERAKRGWTPLDVVGWQKPPYFDDATKNLTWATQLSSEGEQTINHSVRLLGRTGLISAQLVADPDVILMSTIEFDHVLQSFTFAEGSRYAEFRKGDKIAEYGLAALIAGGAGAAAVKSGLLQKLWKVLVVGFVALIGFLKRLFSGGRKSEEPGGAVPAPPAA